MQNGLRGNRGDSLIQVISQGQETLRPGVEYVVTGEVSLWLPPTAPPGKAIVVNNVTTSPLQAWASGATISGIARSNGAAIAATDRVRIAPGQRGVFVANGGNWIAQGCEQALVFSYNSTPLANNTSNPLNASDLFHYLGIVQGGGTWTNPANTAQLVSAASAMEFGTVANYTDRVTSGQVAHTTNTAGSWIGWQFLSPFTCTGFWIQTRGDTNGGQPRSFEIRVNTGTGLTTGANITGWTVAQGWTNQTQVTGLNQYFYFPISTPLRGNQLAIRLTGTDSSGSNFLCLQEVNLFGFYEG